MSATGARASGIERLAPRAVVRSGTRALHVVDLLAAISGSMESGTAVELATDYAGSPTLPEGWDPLVATL